MEKYNVIYKHARGCLHSAIIECPFDDLSPEDKEKFIENVFSKVNPKCKVIVVLPVPADEV